MAGKGRGWDSIVGILRHWAEETSAKTALVCESFAADTTRQRVAFTYTQLDQRARQLAAALQRAGLSGRTVMILAEGDAFICALLACFYAGAIAVPTNQPRPQVKHWQRLERIVEHAQVSAVLCAAGYRETIQGWRDELPYLTRVPLFALEELTQESAEDWREQRLDRDALALIQYTSGSTGAPKGVMVSHGNLTHNLHMVMEATLGHQDGVMVSWLPLFHDMGLMGGLLTPLYMGGKTVIFPPADFIQKPALWLQLMSEHQATVSGGPNFAYAFAAERVSDAELNGVDLSHLRAAFCGAEPVVANTLRAFQRRFAPYGFRDGVLMPCYGMAEATLMVTGQVTALEQSIFPVSRRALRAGRFAAISQDEAQPAEDTLDLGSDPNSVVEVVSCGLAKQYLDVVIADPDSAQDLGQDQVGEIWIRGPSVAQGYWQDEEQSLERFQAWLRGPQGEILSGPYLRSGDLGMLHDGRLFITGRLKDLIIIRGRNYYPHDLEHSLGQQVHGIAKHGVAAVAVPSEVADTAEQGGEQLIIVAELDRHLQDHDFDAIFAEIRQVLAEQHEVVAEDIVLIAPGSILRTTSGKLRRADLARQYLRGELAEIQRTGLTMASPASPAVAQVPGQVSLEQLRQCVAECLHVPVAAVDPEQPLTQLGLDSLRAALLRADIEQRFNCQLSLTELFQARHLNALARCLSWNEEAASAHFAISAQPQRRGEAFPLTDMQQAYWLGRSDVFELGQRSLHGYLELEGGLGDEADVARFQRAWNALVRKHDMLRAIVDETGQQRVLADVPEYPIVRDDLRALDAAERDRQLEQTRQRMSHQCHALEHWPAFEIRASLLPQGARLHLSIDGIFLDFRSFQLLFRELLAALEGNNFDSATPALSFQDYVLALPEARRSAAYERAQRYWRNRLSSLPAAPRLALAQDPSQQAQARMQRREYRMSAAHWQSLQNQAREHGLTPAAVLLTAYGKVLARWSQSQQLSINVPLFNRPEHCPELREVIGNFSSFTLVAMDFSNPCGFVSEASTVQQSLHQALEHSAISGVELLREMNRLRGQVNERAFPVVFTHLPNGLDEWDGDVLKQLEGGLGELIYAITQTPQVWLDNQIWHEDGGLRLHWDGLDSLFPSGMVDEMFAAYTRLLENLATSTSSWRAKSLDLLPSWQRQLLAVSNMTQQDLPPGCAVEWIAARTQRNPWAVAVVQGDTRLSYAELMAHADRLAGALHQQGIGRGHRVAVILPKGWQQVVAVLGILRAGAAYVPLDPANPPARLRALVADCRPRALIAAQALVQRLGLERLPVFDLSQGLEVLDEAEAAPPPRIARQPEDLAYVIYTSGTTGLPKGVMVSQFNLSSMVAMSNRHFEVDARDRVLALTALHHDLSVFDLFAVLAAGGCVVLPDSDKLRDPEHWLDLIREHGVTLWNSVPALLEMLLDFAESDGQSLPRSLRQAWVGGDWVKLNLAQKARRVAPRMALCSIGGPTETTVWNIWYPLPGNLDQLEKIPYGRPAPNNRYYVLNQSGEECPVWVGGELFCAGNGVALGYWNNPRETARRFTPHPRTGERLYRCGDLGRWLPDGNIEFLGRADHQIKLQGVRIEPAEIESCLLRHCGVDAAVVALVQQGARECLGAWVVPAEDKQRADRAQALMHHTGPVLTDMAERISFKLEQRGVRQSRGLNTPLPGKPLAAEQGRAYLQRQSLRQFLPSALSLEQLGRWLGALAQLRLDGKMLPKYRYPSAGGLYPVQVYLYVAANRVHALAPGYYYYHPQQHQLVLLNAEQGPPQTIPSMQSILDQAGFSVWLVADLRAIEPLYGKLARDFCFLEAGYMGQLMMEAASAEQIGLCPLGVVAEDSLRQALNLDQSHLLLHGMAGGPIAPEQLLDWLNDEGLKAIPQRSATAGQQPSVPLVEAIRQRLREHLPDALVPQQIHLLPQLPLTANGKVDRQRLVALANAGLPDSAPEWSGLAADGPGSVADTEKKPPQPPQTPMQEQLVQLWQELLGLEQIGVEDNFFAIGGNSNLLVQAHGRIQQRCGLRFPVAHLFKYPSIRQLAEYLSKLGQHSDAITGSAAIQAATTSGGDAEADRARRQREALRRQRERKAPGHV